MVWWGKTSLVNFLHNSNSSPRVFQTFPSSPPCRTLGIRDPPGDAGSQKAVPEELISRQREERVLHGWEGTAAWIEVQGSIQGHAATLTSHRPGLSELYGSLNYMVCQLSDNCLKTPEFEG